MAKKYPEFQFNWMWAWLFPAHNICRHPRTGVLVRYRMHAANVQRAVKYARRQLGICVLPHELRHGYATHCLERGVNPRAIQAAMGHVSLETTMGYLHAESLSVSSPLEMLEAAPLPVGPLGDLNGTVMGLPRRSGSLDPQMDQRSLVPSGRASVLTCPPKPGERRKTRPDSPRCSMPQLGCQSHPRPLTCLSALSAPMMPPVPQDRPRWEVNIPNRLPALMRAIAELSRVLAQWGADAQALYLAQLAVEEMGTNIIKYGYDDDQEHVIGIRAERDETLFRIRLEDDGHAFNPCQVPEPDPDLSLQERTPGGWGISLVRRLLAGMEYERQDGRNVLRLTVARLASPPVS